LPAGGGGKKRKLLDGGAAVGEKGGQGDQISPKQKKGISYHRQKHQREKRKRKIRIKGCTKDKGGEGEEKRIRKD